MMKWHRHIQAILGAALVVTAGCGTYYFLQDHTTYARGFSKTRFALVRPGLSEERTVMLLGPPLSEDIGPFGEVWYYKPQMPFAFTSTRTRGLILTFRTDGKLADILGAPRAVANAKIQPGTTAADVLKIIGLPERIEPPFYRKAWYSTQQGNMGRYSVFAVLYNAQNFVVGTEVKWEFD